MRFAMPASKPPPNSCTRIGNHDRRGLDRAKHGPESPARRIMQHAADDVGEFTGLLAELEEAPARRGRKLWDAHGANQFIG